MFWWNRNRTYPAGVPLTPLLLLGAVCWGEVRVTSIAYDTARLPCSFSFIQGEEHLLVIWEKVGKDGRSMQVYKFVNGEVNLANQDSQFRGRTVFSGDISQGTLDLTLVGVTQNDDAVYYCRAANKMNRGDNVVVLSVIDRVSKPIIFDISTDQTIILHCVSSTINVTYKWLVNGRETETTKQTYMAPRPKEDVVVRCTVNNTVSKDSQSITIIPYKTGCWKFKKYKRDAVEEMPHISYHPSNGRTLPDILESDCMCDENRDKIPIEGFQKTEEDQRDAAELKYTGGLRPKHDLMRISRLSLDSDYFSDQSKEASESVF
ncbi:uncharacterized protein LOC143981591 isoform X2 [Lithobates pipiens]